PWQHVLDPLAGYLRYAERLAEDPAHAPPALNFAPPDASARPVIDVADRFAARFNDHPRWTSAGASADRQAAIRRPPAAKAAAPLPCRPRLDFESAVAWTPDWYAAHRHGDDMRKLSLAQIAHYEALG